MRRRLTVAHLAMDQLTEFSVYKATTWPMNRVVQRRSDNRARVTINEATVGADEFDIDAYRLVADALGIEAP